MAGLSETQYDINELRAGHLIDIPMYFHVFRPVFQHIKANWVSVIYLHSLHKTTA